MKDVYVPRFDVGDEVEVFYKGVVTNTDYDSRYSVISIGDRNFCSSYYGFRLIKAAPKWKEGDVVSHSELKELPNGTIVKTVPDGTIKRASDNLEFVKVKGDWLGVDDGVQWYLGAPSYTITRLGKIN